MINPCIHISNTQHSHIRNSNFIASTSNNSPLTVHLKIIQIEGLQVELPLRPPQERDHVLPRPYPRVRGETGGQLALVVQEGRRGRLVGLGDGREAQGIPPEQVRTEGQRQRETIHG